MAKSFLNKVGYPRGLRNNNPGNIRGGGNWQGMIGTDSSGFIQFQNVAYGIRAMAIDLTSKIRDGFSTIELIIFKYAPPSDGNDTLAYIASVSNSTGWAQNKTLSSDSTTLRKLIRAIMNVEIGVSYSALLTDADINEGISMATGSVINPGTVGFSLATGLFLLSLYLLATMERMPKQRA